MCQAKRDGGRRCAHHLQRAAQVALASYAAHLSGLTRTETMNMLTELRDRHTPTPTREEVDGFLEAAARQVDTDPTLPGDRRVSIAARLRAALGRVRPDGATFHAWRVLLAAAWARARRGLAAAGLAAGLAATAAGCSGGPPTAMPVPSATATPTASATPTATPTPTATAQGLEATPTLSADVVATFGAERALKGVAFAREALQTAMGMTQLLGPGPHPARDYEPIRPYLTAAAWDGLAKAADAGDPKNNAGSLVRTASTEPGTVGMIQVNDGTLLTPAPPYVTRVAYSTPEVSVERSKPGQPRLLVMVHADLTYTGTRAGQPVTGTDHALRYYALLPTGGGGWLVDSWATRDAPN